MGTNSLLEELQAALLLPNPEYFNNLKEALQKFTKFVHLWKIINNVKNQFPLLNVLWITLGMHSTNVFVFFVFGLIGWSCLLLTLIKCLQGHGSAESLFVCQIYKYHHSQKLATGRLSAASDTVWTAKT